MPTGQAEFSRPISVADIPPKGLRQHLEALPHECAALSTRMGVERVARLVADLEVKPWRSDGISVRGTFEGEVEQICVVTLEPLNNRIADEIVAYFLRRSRRDRHELELVVDPLAEDEPEPLQTGTLDLGELVVEHAILAIDPYPRKEGAHLAAGDEDEGKRDEGPFAALAALKPGQDDE